MDGRVGFGGVGLGVVGFGHLLHDFLQLVSTQECLQYPFKAEQNMYLSTHLAPKENFNQSQSNSYKSRCNFGAVQIPQKLYLAPIFNHPLPSDAEF